MEQGVGKQVEQQLETVGKLIDVLVEFAVAYGFQILGALAGASAFGATLAIQGPLSNYGAGLSIIMARPFVVGDTISVAGTSGVVDNVTLAFTSLIGEDGERITVPNKEIVGQVIVNSEKRRVIETRIAIAEGADADRAIAALRQAIGSFPEISDDPAPQVGIHEFTYGGIVLGLRFWAPSRRYFETRYRVNEAALAALAEAEIRLIPAAATALSAASLSADRPTGA